MRACSGVWVAHGSGSADREVADRHGRVTVPPGRASPTRSGACGSRQRRSWATTTASPTKGSGRCATSPTPGRCSVSRTGSTTRPSTADSPTRSCDEVDSDDPIVLVQDYHFASLPQLIRRAAARRRRSSRSGTFPGRNSERLRHLPVARRAAGRPAGQQHPRIPHAAPLQQLHRRRRSVPGGPHRPRAERRGPRRPRDARPPLPDLDRMAEPLGGRRPAGAGVPDRRVRRARPGAGRAARSGRRPPRLHQRRRGAAAGGRAAAGARPVAARPLHVRRSWRRPAAPPSSGTGSSTTPSRGLAERINARFGTPTYRPIVLLRSHHEPPDGLPLLPRRRRLLREQPARRHEPRGQGVRRRARRRAGRPRAQPVHRRGPRADRGARSSIPTTSTRRARRWPPRCGCRRRSRRSACARCAPSSRSSTSTAGRDGCWWTRPGCGGGSA